MNTELDELSVSREFDKQLEKYFDIRNSSLSSSSSELQEQINIVIRRLEQITLSVSQLAIFSDNEQLEDLQSDSLKLLLLPAILGLLSVKLLDPQRLEILRVASIYFRDFINRCNDYCLTNERVLFEKDKSDEDMLSTNTKIKSIDQMNADRCEKIKRYKNSKVLKERLEEMKTCLKNSDDSYKKEYYGILINYYINEVLDEYSAIKMEKDMLMKIAAMERKGENPLKKDDVSQQKPSKPFLITKDELQKKIYGAGYPSLPTYSVEEFYEQRVKDGIFPGKSDQSRPANRIENDPEADAVAKELADETDDANNRESLMSRDEWRDMHRRGYGNTYNRS